MKEDRETSGMSRAQLMSAFWPRANVNLLAPSGLMGPARI
jgi:hypothetical protein